jgi:hypothetical protein
MVFKRFGIVIVTMSQSAAKLSIRGSTTINGALRISATLPLPIRKRAAPWGGSYE